MGKRSPGQNAICGWTVSCVLQWTLRWTGSISLDGGDRPETRRLMVASALKRCLATIARRNSPTGSSLRAALLLGTTLPERQEIRKAVRDLYRLRSKVVHGRARRSEDNAPDAQCASRGLEICTQAVRAIVRVNAPPDFATWELMGRPPDNEDGTDDMWR